MNGFPKWNPDKTQDPARMTRAYKNALADLVNGIYVAPEYRATEVPIISQARAKTQKADGQSGGEVYAVVKPNTLFETFAASMAAAPASQVESGA